MQSRDLTASTAGTLPCRRYLEQLLVPAGHDLPQLAETDLNPVVARPDGVVVLDVRLRVLPRHAHDPYLRRLHRLYESWFERYDLGPIVRIDTTELDYVENLVDLIALQQKLDKALGAPK